MGKHIVKGLNAFRPSDQTRGAIANSTLTAPPPSASTVTPGRMMGPPAVPLNPDDALVQNSSDDDSIPSTPAQHSSKIFSAISKRKHSALDEVSISGGSSYGSKRSRKSDSSGASALHGIKNMMEGISTSMLNGTLGPPRHHRRSSSEHRIEATALLQEKEDLTVDQMVAFADLFEQNTLKADTYISLVRDDVRKVWVKKQLTDLGFPIASGSDA